MLAAVLLILVGPAGAQHAADTKHDPAAGAPSLGVLDRADTREPLAVAAVAGGLALIGLTLVGVVWRRRAVVIPALSIRSIPRTQRGWQVGASEVALPEAPGLETSVLDATA